MEFIGGQEQNREFLPLWGLDVTLKFIIFLMQWYVLINVSVYQCMLHTLDNSHYMSVKYKHTCVCNIGHGVFHMMRPGLQNNLSDECDKK